MRQRRYAGKYRARGEPSHRIGVEFSRDTRNLTAFEGAEGCGRSSRAESSAAPPLPSGNHRWPEVAALAKPLNSAGPVPPVGGSCAAYRPPIKTDCAKLRPALSRVDDHRVRVLPG